MFPIEDSIFISSWVPCLFCLFVCFELHEQFFIYLAAVTISSKKAANFDLCLELTAFSSEGSFTCHTYCDTGPPFLRSYPKDPWFSLLDAVLLAKERSLPILNVLGFTRSTRAGLELKTSQMLSESTTTTLLQPVPWEPNAFVSWTWNIVSTSHSDKHDIHGLGYLIPVYFMFVRMWCRYDIRCSSCQKMGPSASLFFLWFYKG
jgi:hypothetical protein